MDMIVMELNENPESKIMKQPNVGMVKQEAPEIDDYPLQHEVGTIKTENVSTDDQFESTRLNTFDEDVISNRSLKLKSETVPQDLWFENDEEITVKEELLHEQLDIKSEDEATQEAPVDDKHNLGKTLRNYRKPASGVKPFKCNICDCSFGRNDHLKIHLRTHTDKNPFKCNICDYSSEYNSALKIHLTVHTGEKLVKDNICDGTCAQNSALKSHLTTHTREMPLKCNICHYRFTINSAMKRQIRTHTEEKRFKCNICYYSSAQKCHVERHLRTHTGEKPFKCTICNCRFAEKANLTKHLRRHRS